MAADLPEDMDMYGSFREQLSASAVAQLKRRFPASSSSHPATSATTQHHPTASSDATSSGQHARTAAPQHTATSSSSSGGNKSNRTRSNSRRSSPSGDTTTKHATALGAEGTSASTSRSSSPLKLVEEMLAMPFESPLVSPLRDGPIEGLSPSSKSVEKSTTTTSRSSPPTRVTADDSHHRDYPDSSDSLTVKSTTSSARSRSPTSEASKRKREIDSTELRKREDLSSQGGVKRVERRGTKESDPKRVKRDSTEEVAERERENAREKGREPEALRERRDHRTTSARGSAKEQEPPNPKEKPRSKEAHLGEQGTYERDPEAMEPISHKSKSQPANGGHGSTTKRAQPSGGRLLSNDLKAEANTLKRSGDKAKKEDRAQEALNLYIKAGLKYLECCHQMEREATDHSYTGAADMYKRTARFFEDIMKIATHDRDRLRVSVCYRCVGVALARAFNLNKENLRHQQKDLQGQLKRAPTSSLPTTPDASGSASSPHQRDDSPPFNSGSSKARQGLESSGLGSGFRQTALSFLDEMSDMFKALEVWQKAEAHRLDAERNGLTAASVNFPTALDAFLLQGPAHSPIGQAVEYVLGAVNSL